VPLRGEVSYLLTPMDNGTAVTNIMNLQPSGLLRFFLPLAASRVKMAVAASLDTLKQLLEAAAT
jgi:hypothetical protein